MTRHMMLLGYLAGIGSCSSDRDPVSEDRQSMIFTQDLPPSSWQMGLWFPRNTVDTQHAEQGVVIKATDSPLGPEDRTLLESWFTPDRVAAYRADNVYQDPDASAEPTAPYRVMCLDDLCGVSWFYGFDDTNGPETQAMLAVLDDMLTRYHGPE